MVSPGIAAKGTMSITASEMYFEVDEESSEYKKIDPQVLTNYLLVFRQKHIFSRKNTMHLYPYPHPHYDFFEKFVKLSCYFVFWMWMK